MAVRPGHRRRLPRRRLLSIQLGGAAVLGAIAVCVAVAVGVSQATSTPACASVMAVAGSLAGQTSGEATHYVLAPGTGNCSYPAADTGPFYVALPPAEYGAAAACGSYLEVTGPQGSVTAEVVDQCPDCQSGHIDLSEQAFARIAALSAGLVPVSYHTIADPPLPGPLAVRVKEGSSPYWLALLPIGTGNPVSSVRVSSPSRGWQVLAHTSYNYWLAASGIGPGPYTVQVADSAGHQVTLSGIGLTPGVVQVTGTRMYGAGPPLAATAATAAPPASRPPAPSPGPARTTASPLPARSSPGLAARASQAAASPTPSCADRSRARAAGGRPASRLLSLVRWA
jgi:expansin (peptidoglycan-binding protein)